jgi:hypothetical protein
MKIGEANEKIEKPLDLQGHIARPLWGSEENRLQPGFGIVDPQDTASIQYLLHP